ncbi:Structural maintenance of chromosomes protein 1 [Puccinia graminis f. sp. tritici]|uniref:Structural maintenance of chromosomes protein 1 n=1 Tax=Puccinia graminis f. sp. tritici TaxID=56615 RepID=A0A5B0PNL3_PUCGR|nr:Structural maintenance of chromosomes protein 1 [Puccinia graminis f. sp. tritici]
MWPPLNPTTSSLKQKNFLVFQGDVEAIASQNPKSLSKLIDQISAAEYERKKAAYFGGIEKFKRHDC